MIRVENPRVEYHPRPLAVAEDRPRFSWEVASNSQNITQASYQLRVTSVGVEWDSGVVSSRDTFGIEYAGPALAPGESVQWSVSVTASDGSVGTAEGSFDTAPPEAWWESAEWITLRRTQWQHDDHRPAPYLRTTLRGGSDVVRARVHFSAGGVMEPRAQGARLDASSLAPGWTDYGKRVAYHSYDITEQCQDAAVTIGAVVADGWYAGGVGPFHKRNFWGKHPVLKALIVIDRADGSREISGTSTDWEASFGPILAADLLQGQVIDARIDLGNWSRGDGTWTSPTVEAGPAGRLVPALIAGAAPVAEFAPVQVTEPEPGSTVVDFGQNLAGYVRLSVRGQAGQIVRVRHAEVLYPDGRAYFENLRGARATDTYVLSGGDDTFEPRFTYHGFRYAEITGLAGAEWSAASVAISSLAEMTGEVTTGNALVNQLQHNIQWSMFSNFVEVPTDCPSRDERTGWTGDAQIFAHTATLNADLSRFYTKWLGDIDDTKMGNGSLPDIAPAVVMDWAREGSSGYAEAGIVVPWMMYQAYGDTRILERCFDNAVGWVRYVEERSPDLVWRENRNTDYGDWLAPEETPKDLTATAWFARAAQLVAQFAGVLGRTADEQEFSALHAQIAEAFRGDFVDPSGVMPVGTQTAYTLALAFDLLLPEQRAAAAAELAANVERRGHITTGFLAVSEILPVLTAVGRSDLAYRLLLNDTYPSWGYPIRQGATTIWERWDGWRDETGYQDPLMNSFNHFAVGCVGAWIIESAVGVRAADPGFGTVLIEPQVDPRLGFAETTYQSIRGRIAASWRLDGDQLRVEVELPANVTGRVRLPARDVRIDGEDAPRDDGAVIEIGSGTWVFTGTITPGV